MVDTPDKKDVTPTTIAELCRMFYNAGLCDAAKEADKSPGIVGPYIAAAIRGMIHD